MADAFAKPVKVTRNGYHLPDPETGEERIWTRVTTAKRAVVDMYGLNQHDKRMMIKGLADRPDLLALAESTDLDDFRALDGIADDAKEAAKASAKANYGTALHNFTERWDAGQVQRIPARWKPYMNAYADALKRNGLASMEEWVERVVVIPEIGCAGKFDRILVFVGHGRYVIADVKTFPEKNLKFNWAETELQCGAYSRAKVVWNNSLRKYEPMLPVDQDLGLLIHLPFDQPDGHCEIYELDLNKGWRGAQLAYDVRDWRKNDRDAEDRLLKVADPLMNLIRLAESRNELLAVYNANKDNGWTEEHTAAATRRQEQFTAVDAFVRQPRENKQNAAR